jgi:hypothetical protein
MRRLRLSQSLYVAGLTLLAALPAAALYMESYGGAEPVTLEQAAEYGWPKGTLALVNHPLRKQSWYGIWSGLPNDARQFLYRVDNTDDANQLLAVLQKIETKKRNLLISPESELHPALNKNLKGNASFVIGSQTLIDQYAPHATPQVKKLGDDSPYFHALAPVITVCVGDGRIDLSKLIIPKGVDAKVLSPLPKDLDPKLRAQLDAFAAAH